MQKESKKQLLIINPKNEISFKGPYDHVVTEYFDLKNPTEYTIAFKVKTTAPKRYCVRPNNGLVLPEQSVQVAVMLQPGDLAQEKHKHKFMIQSVIVPNNNQANTNVDELFKSATPDEIMDSKFKCVFLDGSISSGPTITASTVSPLMTSSNVTSTTTNTAHSQSDDHHQPESTSTDDFLANGSHPPSSGGAAEYSSASPIGGDSSNFNNAFDHNENAGMSNFNEDHYDYAGALKSKKTNQFSKHGNDLSSSNPTHENVNQDKNDVESELRSAQEEIRMLKDKLQQVQSYAKKFASTTSEDSKNENKSNQGNGFVPNNQQLIQLSAMVVFISFIIGIFFGKTIF